MESIGPSGPALQLVHLVQQLYQVPINPAVLDAVSSVTVVPLSSSAEEPNVIRTVVNSKTSSLLSSTSLSARSKSNRSAISDVAGVKTSSLTKKQTRCQIKKSKISTVKAGPARTKATRSCVLQSSLNVNKKEGTEYCLVTNEIGERAYISASSLKSKHDCDEMWHLPNDICRICAKSSESIEHVFSDKSKKLGFVEMIHSYLPILVSPEDLLPLNVCQMCISSLQVTDKLVKTCVAADNTLRILVERVCKLSPTAISVKNFLLNSDATVKKSFLAQKNGSNSDMIEESSCNSLNQCETQGSHEENNENRTMTSGVNEILFESAATCEIKSNCGAMPSVDLGNDNILRPSSPADEADLLETVDLTQGCDFKEDWDENSQSCDPLRQPDSVDFEGILSSTTMDIEKHSSTVKVSKLQESLKKKLSVKIRRAGQLEEKRALLKLHKSLTCCDCDFFAATKEELGEHRISHFKCKYCSKPHKSRISLIEHERIHTKEKPFVCDKCGWRFRTKYQMMQHAQRHNPETPYECKICGRRFSVKTTYKAHLLRHNEESPFLCETCGKSFKLQAALRFHRFSHRTFKCTICDKSFSYRAFQVHKRSHSGEGFTCSECGKMFLSREHLKNHMLIHEGLFPFKCGVCHRSFKRITHLQAHRPRHAGDLLLQLKFYVCAVCDESFEEAVKLSAHMRNHSKEEKLTTKSFRCSSCDKCFVEEHELHSHELQHNMQLFSCGTCNKSFSQRDELDKHASDHFEDKPHACDICGKRFGAVMNLNSHKAIHLSDKPYSCELCIKSFKTLNGLNQHKMVHSDERKFPCPICELSFKRRDALKNHERTHFTERPYTCSVCARSFKVKSDCTTHLRRHRLSGIDGTVIQSSYSCDACPQTFILKVDLSNHIHSCHHLEDPEPNINAVPSA